MRNFGFFYIYQQCCYSPIRLVLSCLVLLLLFLGCRSEQPSSIISLEIEEQFRLGNGYFRKALLSPDSSKLAIAGSLGVWVYETETLTTPLFIEGHAHHVDDVSWSPDSQWLASSSRDHTIRVWNMETGNQQFKVDLPNHTSPHQIVWSPTSDVLASSSEVLRLWDMSTGEPITKFEKSSNPVVWSPDGTKLAFYRQGELQLWDADSYQVRTAVKLTDTLSKIAWSPNSRSLLLTSSRSGDLWMYDLHSEQTYAIPSRYIKASNMVWSPNGLLLALNKGKVIYILNDKLDKLLYELDLTEILIDDLHGEFIRHLAWSSDSRQLAFGSAANGVLSSRLGVWMLPSEPTIGSTIQPELQMLSDHLVNGYINIAWLPDNERLVESGSRSTVRVWNVTTKTIENEAEILWVNADSLAWSPDRTRLTINGDGGIRSWQLATSLSGPHKSARQLYEFKDKIGLIAWNPSPTLAFAASHWSEPNKIRIELLEGDSGKTLQVLDHQSAGWLGHLTWSPNGHQLATSTVNELKSFPNQLSVWDLQADPPHPIWTDTKSLGRVRDVDWTPDGRTLAATDGRLHLWDTSRWQKRKTITETYSFDRMAWGG